MKQRRHHSYGDKVEDIKLTAEQLALLEAAARARGISVNSLIGEAVAERIQQERSPLVLDGTLYH